MNHDQKQKLISIFHIEMTFRKALYPQQIADKVLSSETANHRYYCLATALYMIEQGRPPAEIKPLPDVLAEILRWSKHIQRNATKATMRGDGQRIAVLTAFIEHYSPEPEQDRVVQTELF